MTHSSVVSQSECIALEVFTVQPIYCNGLVDIVFTTYVPVVTQVFVSLASALGIAAGV